MAKVCRLEHFSIFSDENNVTRSDFFNSSLRIVSLWRSINSNRSSVLVLSM